MKILKRWVAAITAVAFASTAFATVPTGCANLSNCNSSDNDTYRCTQVCNWIRHDNQRCSDGQDELNKCWDHFCKTDCNHFFGPCPFSFKGKCEELLLIELLLALLLDECHQHPVSPHC